MARKKDTPQKAALREMMGNYCSLTVIKDSLKEDRQRGKMKKYLDCFCGVVFVDNKSIMW